MRIPLHCGAVVLASLAFGCDGDETMGEDTGPPPTTDSGPPPPMDAGVDAGGYVAVSLYTSLDIPDDDLADQAVALLVGSPTEPRCRTCHGLTPDTVRNWGTQTDDAMTCITGLDPNVPDDAMAILDCFRVERVADASLLGLVSTAVTLEWFTRAFDVYYPMTAGPEQVRFLQTGRMPKPPGVLLEQPDVDVLLTWWERGFPGLDDRLTIDGGLTCTPMIGPEVAAHVTTMETEGWGVLNRDRGISMAGCGAGEVGAACLTSFPSSTARAYADGWVVEDTLRILFEYTYSSSFWTRSSADGRFVSHGGSPEAAGGGAGAAVIDIERGVVIPAEALYDPGFFPDNSGFMIQGTGRGGGFCRQSLLYTEPTRITFREPECSTFRAVGLYQHMAAIDGGDYWTVFGQFVSDDGGHSPTLSALAVPFDVDSQISLVPLVFDGSSYDAQTRIRVDIPFEGDTVISPSGRLLISRARGEDGSQAGYVLRALNATPSGSTYVVDTPEIARYCGRGSKPFFSFDERYMTFQRYVIDDDALELGFLNADDPGFAPYRVMGAANIYVTDLTTGATRRITNMNPGQYALFPHFRSDGWIYFIVRDSLGSGSNEYIVASDAILTP